MIPSSSEPANKGLPRYALIFKTHAWDAFVSRQFSRYCDAGRGADVFVIVDETNASVGPIDHGNVLRIRNDDLIALGLANRSERGNLIWWNNDYINYLFFDRFPGYDFYLFVEYDSVINRDIDDMIREVSAAGADFVALPTRGTKANWMWTWHHLPIYNFDSIAGSLNCISIFSNRALEWFMRRRIEMSRASNAGDVEFWPYNEVFLATEAKQAGLKFLSLEQFGNADRYEWYPPYLEDDLEECRQFTFVHPVLDRPRYMASLLKFSWMSDYFSSTSRLGQDLKRFPEYKPMVVRAFLRRAVFRTTERYQNARAKLRARRAEGGRRRAS